MKSSKNIWPPVTSFEKQTTYCAIMVADIVVWEVEVYFQQPLPPSFAEKLAHRAERIATGQKDTVRLFQNWHSLKAFMRHWLASILATESPSLYHRLPDDFKVGHPLPLEPKPASPEPPRAKRIRATHLVPGWELLLP